MASEQMSKRENVTDEREIPVEKDTVPKMTTHFESLAENVRASDVPTGRDSGELRTGNGGEEGREKGGDDERKGPSLEEISKYRATAQQNSMEALRAAEERYANKVKELGASAFHKVKESAGHGLGGATTFAAERGGAVKDTALEKGQQGYVSAKDYALQKAAQAKDVVTSTGETVVHYVGEKAAVVKDKAAVAGWGAAHYTLEKAEETTEMVVSVAADVAGLAGGKVVAAKDVVAGAGQTAKEYAGEKLAAAKDAVVATEETAKEYTARKKAEAQKDLEAKKAAESKGESGGTETSEEQQDIAAGAPENERSEQQGVGVLQAIGETIVEIGQTTKELLAGQGKTQPDDDGRYEGGCTAL